MLLTQRASSLLPAPVPPAFCNAKTQTPNTARQIAAFNGKLTEEFQGQTPDANRQRRLTEITPCPAGAKFITGIPIPTIGPKHRLQCHYCLCALHLM